MKVLIIYGGVMSYGGMETFIMAYLRNMDITGWQIDVIEHGSQGGVFDKELIEIGCRVFYVTPRAISLTKNLKELSDTMKYDSYDIVWTHMDAANYYALKVAKKAKIPIRISHSHNTNFLSKNMLKVMNLRIIKRLIPLYATHLFACSTQAGEWMYGKRPFSIIPNAIDFQAFRFDLQRRKDIRKSLCIPKDTFVVGHIGRFDYQKNHQFLIKVFKKLLEVSPGAKLVLVGEGNNVDEIRALVSSYRIIESVLFLGHRDDIPDLLAAMDCFVLPSHFEGLGIVLLEAQANGLPCVVSSAVPNEVDYSGLVSFIDLCEPLSVWISEIIKVRNHRNTMQDSVFNTSNYNIVQAAKNLRDKLISVHQNTTR